MSAARLLETARAAGLSIEIDGGDLIVEADRDPPAELLNELRQHKAELIAVLRPASDKLSVAPIEVPEARSASPECRDDLGERAALVEDGTHVWRRWAEGFAALSSMPVPTGFSPSRWQRIVDAAGHFLDRWAAEAIRCGWNDRDVFACNPARPDARFDYMGLVLLLDRCEVVSLDKTGADLLTENNTALRYRRRSLPADAVNLWDLAAA